MVKESYAGQHKLQNSAMPRDPPQASSSGTRSPVDTSSSVRDQMPSGSKPDSKQGSTHPAMRSHAGPGDNSNAPNNRPGSPTHRVKSAPNNLLKQAVSDATSQPPPKQPRGAPPASAPPGSAPPSTNTPVRSWAATVATNPQLQQQQQQQRGAGGTAAAGPNTKATGDAGKQGPRVADTTADVANSSFRQASKPAAGNKVLDMRTTSRNASNSSKPADATGPAAGSKPADVARGRPADSSSKASSQAPGSSNPAAAPTTAAPQGGAAHSSIPGAGPQGSRPPKRQQQRKAHGGDNRHPGSGAEAPKAPAAAAAGPAPDTHAAFTAAGDGACAGLAAPAEAARAAGTEDALTTLPDLTAAVAGVADQWPAASAPGGMVLTTPMAPGSSQGFASSSFPAAADQVGSSYPLPLPASSGLSSADPPLAAPQAYPSSVCFGSFSTLVGGEEGGTLVCSPEEEAAASRPLAADLYSSHLMGEGAAAGAAEGPGGVGSGSSNSNPWQGEVLSGYGSSGYDKLVPGYNFAQLPVDGSMAYHGYPGYSSGAIASDAARGFGSYSYGYPHDSYGQGGYSQEHRLPDAATAGGQAPDGAGQVEGAAGGRCSSATDARQLEQQLLAQANSAATAEPAPGEVMLEQVPQLLPAMSPAFGALQQQAADSQQAALELQQQAANMQQQAAAFAEQCSKYQQEAAAAQEQAAARDTQRQQLHQQLTTAQRQLVEMKQQLEAAGARTAAAEAGQHQLQHRLWEVEQAHQQAQQGAEEAKRQRQEAEGALDRTRHTLQQAQAQAVERESALQYELDQQKQQLGSLEQEVLALREKDARSQKLLDEARDARKRAEDTGKALREELAKAWADMRTLKNSSLATSSSTQGGDSRAGAAGAGSSVVAAAAAGGHKGRQEGMSQEDLCQLLLGLLSDGEAAKVGDLESQVDANMAPDSWKRKYQPQHGTLAHFIDANRQYFGRRKDGNVYALQQGGSPVEQPAAAANGWPKPAASWAPQQQPAGRRPAKQQPKQQEQRLPPPLPQQQHQGWRGSSAGPAQPPHPAAPGGQPDRVSETGTPKAVDSAAGSGRGSAAGSPAQRPDSSMPEPYPGWGPGPGAGGALPAAPPIYPPYWAGGYPGYGMPPPNMPPFMPSSMPVGSGPSSSVGMPSLPQALAGQGYPMSMAAPHMAPPVAFPPTGPFMPGAQMMPPHLAPFANRQGEVLVTPCAGAQGSEGPAGMQ